VNGKRKRLNLPSLLQCRRVLRVRSLLLLVVLVAGSILGRDAALLHQILTIREYAVATAIDQPDAQSFAKPPPTARARPSGLSKRQAWSPTDPPDDDDENDDDSDTVAARFVSVEPMPRVVIHAAVSVLSTETRGIARPTPTCIDLLCAPPRGPPLPA
jgi:hypothetical protein